MTLLHTPRLMLRPARPSDVEPLHAIFTRPEAMRYWSTPPHSGIAQTREWLDGMIAIPSGSGEDFIIEHGGEVIGKAGFFRFPEIGFMLSPDHWGKGLAREALESIISRAFSLHGLARIVADVDPRNTASLGLLKRFGFTQTGYRERSWLVGEEWCDSVDLALDRTDAALAPRADVP